MGAWGFGPMSGWGCGMNVDERIRFLLRTAIRAEGAGDLRIAVIFRRMAEDMRPMERALAPVPRRAYAGYTD